MVEEANEMDKVAIKLDDEIDEEANKMDVEANEVEQDKNLDRQAGMEKCLVEIWVLFALRLPSFAFLDASTHLYKPVCLSVRPSVRPSVHDS